MPIKVIIITAGTELPSEGFLCFLEVRNLGAQSGRRSAIAGAWSGWIAGGRLFHHAISDISKHQCPSFDDWG